MPLIPEIASNALAVRKYLKSNEIKPEKEFTKLHQNESTKKWVYTYQCQFHSEEEAKTFVKFCKILNAGMLDIK